MLRDELEDRFGPIPPPLENLIALQQARIKLGEAGARAVSFRGGRLAVTPIDLDAERAKRLKEQLPESLYEPGKSQFSLRVPDDPEHRFPAVVACGKCPSCRNGGRGMISRYAGRSIDQGSHVMLSKYRSLALCAFFVLPALLLSACGSDVPGNSVAKVGDQSIRRSTFDHWMQIAAVSAAGQTATTGAAPKAQVPDAPSFTKCIAQKKATAGKPAKGQPEPTEAQLKGQCQQEYNQLRDQVLEFLIRGNWIEQETKKQNLKVSDKDVQKQIDAAVKQAFQNPGDFQKFLAALRPDAGRRLLPAAQPAAAAEAHREGDQGAGHRHRRPDPAVLRQEQVEVLDARAA